MVARRADRLAADGMHRRAWLLRVGLGLGVWLGLRVGWACRLAADCVRVRSWGRPDCTHRRACKDHGAATLPLPLPLPLPLALTLPITCKDHGAATLCTRGTQRRLVRVRVRARVRVRVRARVRIRVRFRVRTRVRVKVLVRVRARIRARVRARVRARARAH